jgi:hypothetical protein
MNERACEWLAAQAWLASNRRRGVSRRTLSNANAARILRLMATRRGTVKHPVSY